MAPSEEIAVHSPPSYQVSPPQRPKGILKNSNSFARSNSQTSPEALEPAQSPERPELERTLTEKEITLQNTLSNAGPHRRSSSNPRGPPSRRQSGQVDSDPSKKAITFDELKLLEDEYQRGGKMKITEPKTPFVRNYDPAEEEDEISTLDADQLMVDELDRAKPPKRQVEDIPGLDIGEAEMDVPMERSDSKQRVAVDPSTINTDPVDSEEHKAFEKSRKQHYRMENIKDMLAHPENNIVDDDDDEDGDEVPVPPLPQNAKQA